MNNDTTDDHSIDVPKVLSYAFRLYKENFMFFFTMGLIYAFSNMFDSVLTKLFGAVPRNEFLIFTVLVSSWVSIALIYLSAQAYKGAEANIKKAFVYARGMYFRYLAMILFALVIFGLMVSIGSAIILIPALYFATLFMFTDLVIVLEQKKIIDALKRSMDLVKPVFWKVFMFNIITVMIVITPGIVMFPLMKVNPILAKNINTFLVAIIIPYYMLAQVGLFNRVKKYAKDREVEV